MKLYSLPHSPYSARIRMQIYTKQLAIQIVPPEIAIKTDEFKASYPMGKVPMLGISDEILLPESTAIAEYLEDVYPETPCRPSTPLAASITRATVSFANAHLGPSLFPLFKNLAEKDSHTDKTVFIAPLCVELAKLERWMEQEDDREGLDIGDFALASNIWYATILAPAYEQPDVLADYPKVNTWWNLVKQDPHVSKVIDEMTTGFAGFMQKMGL